MKYAVVADVHVWNHRAFAKDLGCPGLNSRALGAIKALDRAASLAMRTIGCDALVVAGDLFHHPDPSPQLLYETALAISHGAIVMPGNHDMASEHLSDHALLPFHLIDNVTVTEITTEWAGGLCMMPFRRRNVVEYLRDEATYDAKVIVGHFGIVHAGTPAVLRLSDTCVTEDALFAHLRETQAFAVVAGDWHRHYHAERDGLHVVQVGALAPVSWSDWSSIDELLPEKDPYGKVVVVDTDERTVEVHTVPGPRFVRAVASNPDDARTVVERLMGTLSKVPDGGAAHEIYLDVTVPPQQVGDVQEVLASVHDRVRSVKAVRVRPGSTCEEDVRKIREAVTTASRLRDAVDRFVRTTWGDAYDDDVIEAVNSLVEFAVDR